MQEFLSNLSIKNKIIIGIMGIIIVLVFIILFINFYSDNSEAIIINNETEAINETNDKTTMFGIIEQNKKITIHIIGEVNNPGVYTLNENSRIKDAIDNAGGQTEDADLSKINLAYIIEDGMQIYVPSYEENKQDYITEEAGEGVIVETLINDTHKNSKVNINLANKEKLLTLPGVGESTAQKIIDYRNKNGKFKQIEELKNISGIGDSKFNNLKERIII